MITAEEFLKGGTSSEPASDNFISAEEFLKQQTSQQEIVAPTQVLPQKKSLLVESGLIGFGGVPRLSSELEKKTQKITTSVIEKISQIPEVNNTLLRLYQGTTGTGIVSAIKASKPDITFKQAYESARESQLKNDSTILKKFLTQLGDSAPQTLLGVGLNFVPVVGKPLATAYWTAVSAGSQIEEKGKVYSPTNILIDVVGDSMLGTSIESLFKKPTKTLLQTVKKTFATEGGTEVAQDLLKFANNYRSAKTDNERKLALDQAKNYFKSGQILMTLGVGGLTGAGIGAGAYGVSNIQQRPTPPLPTPTQEPQISTKFSPVSTPVEKPVEKTQETINVEGIGEVPIVGTVDNKTGFITADEYLKQVKQEKPSEEIKQEKKISEEPLIQEARKYKEAKDFLVKQGIPNVEKSINWIKNILGDGTKDEEIIRKSINVLKNGKQNPNSQRAFEIITGKKLPSTQKEAQVILEEMAGLTPTHRKWMTEKEVKDFVEANKGKYVIIDDNKSDWKVGREVRTSNPVINKIVGIEDNLVVYSRGGGEFSRPISSIRDFVVDGKSIIGDVKNEEYAKTVKPKVELPKKKPVPQKSISIHKPIKQAGDIKLSTPTSKSAYYPAMKGTYKGKSFTTDSFIFELDNVEANLNAMKDGKDLDEKMLTNLFDATKDNKTELKEPIGYKKAYTKSKTALVFELGKEEILLDPRYYNYLSKKYKNLKLMAGKNNQAIRILDDNKFVGLVMPMNNAEGEVSKFTEPIKGTSATASIGKFRDGTPITLSQTENIKIIELPEMVQLAKEIMGQTPKVRQKVGRMFGGMARGVFRSKDGSITLRSDLFDPDVNTIDQASKTLAHELGHLIDWLPDKNLKRGNLLGRLSTLRDFRKDFWAEAGQSRTNQEIKDQLWELSKYWKPIDENTVSESFLKYRKSPQELYADFISVVFNDPALAMEKAPTAYNVFFEQLDKKPAVRDAYFDLQALLSGERKTIIDARRQGVQKMFKEGDIKSIDYQARLQEERKARRANSLQMIKFNLVDNNIAMIDRVKELENKGVYINPDEDPRYLLEERNYLSGAIKADMEENVAPIYDALKQADIAWETFGEKLFYDRIIAGDRSKQANPRGITPEVADELLADLNKGLTDEQTQVLEEQTVKFREWLRGIAEKAYQEGLYSKKLYDQMKANPSYVTFRVIDHIEEGVDSKVYKSIGTLKDITNPADASIFKVLATIHAIERNKVKRVSVDFLNKNYPKDIEKAKQVFTGKGQRFIESKDPNKELIIFKKDGKVEGYYVDPYIAHSLNNDTIGQNNAIMKLISPISIANRRLFRPVFIGYNPGFQAFNLVRDFKRFWKNNPTVSLGSAVKKYYQAMPEAKARAFGIKENATEREKLAQKNIQELEKSKVLSTTYTDYTIGEARDEKQIDLVLKSVGIESNNEQAKNTAMRKVLSPFIKLLDIIQKTGNYIETLPKVAAAYEFTGGDFSKLTAEKRSYIRKYVGSPDFLTRGYASPITNELFLFSNAITQGLRSDYKIMSSPKTRSGYWWKTAKLTFLPKILMFMASMGLFGKALKDLFDDASEYDKTNYTIIPFGKDENNKTIYLRLPDDETGRLLGAVAWKSMSLMNFNEDKQFGKELSDIFALLGGQIPSITPTISTSKDIYDYLSGRNPYDDFRGRNVLSDDLFKANNWDTDKAFLGYIFNQLGGGVFYKFSANGSTPQKTGTEEELVNLPVVSNIVGRFIRVSDYGKSEQLRKVQEKIQQEKSIERIEDRKLINKYVELINENPEKRSIYEREMIREKFGNVPIKKGQKEEINNLKKKLKISLTRSISGADVDAITYATSNDEKAVILDKISENMQDIEFNKLKYSLLREGLISKDVINKYNDLGKNKENSL